MKSHNNSIHNGRKDHKYDLCGKASSSSGVLKSHVIAVHNGQKDFTCNICAKSFALSGYLNTHIKTVHGKKITTNVFDS